MEEIQLLEKSVHKIWSDLWSSKIEKVKSPRNFSNNSARADRVTAKGSSAWNNKKNLKKDFFFI